MTSSVQPESLNVGIPALEISSNYYNSPDVEIATSSELDVATPTSVSARMKQGAATAVVLAELSWLNESMRVGAWSAGEAISHSPIVGMATVGLSTLAIEGAAAIAGASILDSDTAKKATDFINTSMAKFGYGPEKKTSRLTKIAATFMGGTVVGMALEQLDDPSRTKEQNRRSGLISAAWLAGVCSVYGAVGSEGYELATDHPITSAAVVGGVVAVAAGKKIAKKMRREQEAVNSEVSLPRYDLSAEEMHELETEFVAEVKSRGSQDGMTAAWISPTNKFANLIRMNEKAHFPEVSEITPEDEEHTMFLAIIDTRPGADRVVHGATITGLQYDHQNECFAKNSLNIDGTTGFYTVDSLIERGNFTADEFNDYYTSRGINVLKSFAVETNFRIGDKPEKFHGVGTADLSYLMMLDLMKATEAPLGASVVFASVNHASKSSFERVGLKFEPLMGRNDFDTEESELGKESDPIAIHYDQSASDLLEAINIDLPKLYF